MPFTAGVSGKEPLMRLPINKPFCREGGRGKGKRHNPLVHVACGTGLSYVYFFRVFFQKVKTKLMFFLCISHEENYLILFDFCFFSQYENYLIFTFIDVSQWKCHSLPSLKIYVTLWKHIPKALEPKSINICITWNKLFLGAPPPHTHTHCRLIWKENNEEQERA